MENFVRKFRITPPLYKCIVVLCVAIATLALAACSGIAEEGAEKKVRINLPPIASGARSISDDRIPDLKGDVRRYRVTVNGTTREGTGSSYEFTLPVGARASVTVECLNSNGDVIIRAEKAFVVSSGENNFSINLKNDGTEIVPAGAAGRVTYSWGEANKDGNKSGLPSDPTTYSEGDLFTVEDGSGMTWDHATQQSGFTGWSASPAIEPENVGQATNAPISGQKYKMPKGGVTLTAQWNKKSYTITYDMNAAGSGGTQTSTPINPGSVQALEDYTIDGTTPASVSDGVKNYTFMEWSDGNGNTYAVGRKITNVTGNITLTAQWSDKDVWTVTYNKGSTQADTQDITNWIDSDNAEDGNSVTLPTLTATGYTFTGWQITGETGNKTGGYTPTQNVTATAQWTVNSYRVTYSLDGGSGGPASGDVQYNASVSLDAPTKAGYNFTGWSYNGTAYGGTSGNSSLTMPAQAITLTAQWNEMTTLYVSDSGNDTTGDGSNAKPFATVQKAIDIVNGLTGTDLTISISGTISVTTEITFSVSGKTITVSGSGTLQRATSFTSGSMIRVSQGTVKFNGPTLDGNNVKIAVSGAVLNISGSGVIVELVSGTIKKGATSDAGGGVAVGSGSTFKMSGGTITENDAEWGGGGVNVDGTFEMTNGTIIKNNASGSSADGGGVNVNSYGVFTMGNGSITQNTCARYGGGVKLNDSGATFTLNGGSITNNTANGQGGGVWGVAGSTFNGTGGTLSGNLRGSTPDNYEGTTYTGSATGSWVIVNITIVDEIWSTDYMDGTTFGSVTKLFTNTTDTVTFEKPTFPSPLVVGTNISQYPPIKHNDDLDDVYRFVGWIESTVTQDQLNRDFEDNGWVESDISYLITTIDSSLNGKSIRAILLQNNGE